MNFFATFPVTDVERSKAFFAALGWGFDERMTDHNTACIKVDDNVHLMAVSREFFDSLGRGRKQVGDPATTSMVAFAFDFPSREDVDAFVAKAAAAGATIGETDDYGFMYQVDFEDPDGNQFAPFWMAPEGPPKA